MAFKLPGWSPFKNDNDKYPTRPLKPGEGKPKGGVAPLPGLSKGLMAKILKQFNKGACVARKQSNIIKRSLEKEGKTFINRKK